MFPVSSSNVRRIKEKEDGNDKKRGRRRKGLSAVRVDSRLRSLC